MIFLESMSVWASFARYFKKHTGVTPTEYREGK